MIIGTAGFTAALALYRMQQNGQTPELGPVVVTGATGGVGMLAIDILTCAGYSAHAITGKADQFDFLIGLGAKQCISRKELFWSQRPLETARWGGAIDNVGGDMLAGLSRVIEPFIIRGLSLLGIASAGTVRRLRDDVWQHLADDWKPKNLDKIATKEAGFDELGPVFTKMLAGESFGRTLVRIG